MFNSLIIILIFGVVGNYPDDLFQRAQEFYNNVYTGKAMQADEWLTKKAQLSPLFKSFGGLDAVVKNSTEEAMRNQGMKYIKLLNVKKKGIYHFVEFKIFFNNKQTSSGMDSWVMENGKWKITVKLKE
jgi:hypothetical protein